ncbi:MAG: heavy-metal-associated domain-containing protein [Candidatus Methylomirabilales bacterium]
MTWVVVATILAFFLLLSLRLLRHLSLGQATIHLAHMKSEAQALQVAKTLRGLRGVVEVRVDLEGHLARITYRKGKVAIEEMLQALHGAGF